MLVFWTLKLLNRSEIIREVMRGYNANGAMLRWPDQLLLAAENDHFEGSTYLRSKEGTKARLVEGGGGLFWEQNSCLLIYPEKAFLCFYKTDLPYFLMA